MAEDEINRNSIQLPDLPEEKSEISLDSSHKSATLKNTLLQLKDNIKVRQSIMESSFHHLRESRSERKTTGWGTLPPQILTKIFQNVDRHHLISFCTLVCTNWRRVIMSNEFITSLTISNSDASLSFIYNFLREYKMLQKLSLNNVPDLEAILLQAHKTCIDLKYISLTNYPFIAYKILDYISKYFPKLEGLNFESSNVDCMNLSTDITYFTSLKSLNLFNVKAVGLSTQAILEIVLNCRDLEELNIGLCPPLVNLFDEDVMVIITNLSPKLTSLALDSRKLTMRSLEKLKSCQLLRRLNIKYAVNLTSDFLTEFWKSLTALDEFGFTHNCIINGYDVSMLVLNGAIVFADLVHLDLTYCVKVDDIGIEAVAAVCGKLQKILLKSCRSVTTIVPLVKNCKELRFIDVSYCTRLKLNFDAPKLLQVLIIDDRKPMMYFIEKFRSWRHLKIYVSVSEFSDHLELV